MSSNLKEVAEVVQAVSKPNQKDGQGHAPVPLVPRPSLEVLAVPPEAPHQVQAPDPVSLQQAPCSILPKHQKVEVVVQDVLSRGVFV